MLCFGVFWPSFQRNWHRGQQETGKERGMTCNKGPLPESNQGHYDYIACVVTTQLPKHSNNLYVLLCYSAVTYKGIQCKIQKSDIPLQ